MHINPNNLRRLRRERGLSRRELADMSRVSQKQIQRLEDPEQASTNVRSHTVSRLASALDVELERLVRQPQIPGFKITRISASLLPGVRLAYELVERRYGLNAGQLINAAPLFFALLAEGSLAWRQNQLDALWAAIDQVRARRDDRTRATLHAEHATHDLGYEQEAINRGDLFSDPYPQGYDFDPDEEWDGSPFADYMRQLTKDLGKPDVVDAKGYGWDGAVSGPGVPTYSVCRVDLNKIAPWGSHAHYALHAGDVRLSDIPEPLMAEDAAERREAWLEEQLSSESKDWLAFVPDLASFFAAEEDTEPDQSSHERSGA